MNPILQAERVTKRFGGLVACSEISFSVQRGEIFGVIGPNGAGKTTLFNVIAGHFRPTAGTIAFEGRDITDHSSDEIGRSGIARTFQAVHVFKKHTVAENLHRASVLASRHDPYAYFFRRNSKQSRQDWIADFLGFADSLHSVAGALPYGLQKMLGVGMALMAEPKLLLMDEPVAGLNPSEKKVAGQLIRRLRDELGMSILLVEHDMPLVMGICDRILVINQGIPVTVGTPRAIKADQRVIDAYLGEDYEFA
jgi:branched-chain amino acid transport system ATP-binding protein